MANVSLSKINNASFRTNTVEALDSEDYFMAVALLNAMRSDDAGIQGGACIVNEDGKIVGVGYNSFLSGCQKESKRLSVSHAELNAVLNKNSESLKNCAIYVALFPCSKCAKVIIQSGIKKVVFLSDDCDHRDNTVSAKRLFDSAGVKYQQFVAKQLKIEINLAKGKTRSKLDSSLHQTSFSKRLSTTPLSTPKKLRDDRKLLEQENQELRKQVRMLEENSENERKVWSNKFNDIRSEIQKLVCATEKEVVNDSINTASEKKMKVTMINLEIKNKQLIKQVEKFEKTLETKKQEWEDKYHELELKVEKMMLTDPSSDPNRSTMTEDTVRENRVKKPRALTEQEYRVEQEQRWAKINNLMVKGVRILDLPRIREELENVFVKQLGLYTVINVVEATNDGLRATMNSYKDKTAILLRRRELEEAGITVSDDYTSREIEIQNWLKFAKKCKERLHPDERVTLGYLKVRWRGCWYYWCDELGDLKLRAPGRDFMSEYFDMMWMRQHALEQCSIIDKAEVEGEEAESSMEDSMMNRSRVTGPGTSTPIKSGIKMERRP